MKLRAIVFLGVVAAGGVTAGCGQDPPPPPPPGEAAAPQAPIDELAEGELSEGTASAFGLPLPSSLQVRTRSDRRVLAVGPPPLEEVANFVRARVDAKETVTGPTKTVLDGVTVKAPRAGSGPRLPASRTDVDEVLKVEISRTPDSRTHLVVSRSLRAKVPEGLSEEQRWEKLGIRKDGKPADPKKFE